MLKQILALSIGLLAIGCQSRPPSLTIHSEPAEPYVLIEMHPTELHDAMAATMWPDFDKLPRLETQVNVPLVDTTLPVNGQRTVRLLEIATHADMMCHPIEHVLRRETLSFVEANLETPGVRDALNWIRTDYQTKLPEDKSGMLRNSMNNRMKDHATNLLQSPSVP